MKSTHQLFDGDILKALAEPFTNRTHNTLTPNIRLHDAEYMIKDSGAFFASAARLKSRVCKYQEVKTVYPPAVKERST